MPRRTNVQREFARIRDIDQALAIMGERNCSLSEAWQIVLDGEDGPDA